MRLDPGNVHCSTRLRELVELSAARVGKAYRQVIYRVDGGYGTQPQVKWFMATNRLFTAKGAVCKREKRAARVAPGAWQLVGGCAGGRGSGGGSSAGHRLRSTGTERQTIEAFFKVGRNVYVMDNLRSREFKAINGFLWLVFIGPGTLWVLLQWVKQALFAGTALAGIGT